MVSIIIPTYNRAYALERVVKMLTSQTYSHLEIIFVNDGSTDNTAEVLRKLALKDDRIKVINKENGGPSSARNLGIRYTTGDYIFFIDDDDLIPSDYIASFMIEKYRDDDIVIDSYSTQSDDNNPVAIKFEPQHIIDATKAIEYLMSEKFDNCYVFFPFGKRFRTKVIQTNNIRFDTQLKLGEDRPFVIDAILFSENCRIINNHKYVVRNNSTSDYRLSKGYKDCKWLWNNFKRGYEYLLSVDKKIEGENVKIYADNFLATKLTDYIFLPYVSGVYHSKKDKVVIKESMEHLFASINLNNLQRKENKIFFMLLKINFSLAFLFLRIRLYAYRIKQKMQ